LIYVVFFSAICFYLRLGFVIVQVFPWNWST